MNLLHGNIYFIVCSGNRVGAVHLRQRNVDAAFLTVYWLLFRLETGARCDAVYAAADSGGSLTSPDDGGLR